MFRWVILLISIVGLGIFISCNDTTTPVSDAVLMEKSEISKTIGYTWFNDLWNYYEPNDSVKNLISTAFDSTKHKFIVFLEPDCECKELVREPVYVIKILDEANISSKNYEIYATGSITSNHPYKSLFTISSLPFVALITSDAKVYSVLDSFNYWKDRRIIRLENIVLEALEK